MAVGDFFKFPDNGELSDGMTSAYHRDGFLVLTDFASSLDCAKLIARAQDLVEAFEPEDTKTIFSTHEQAHARDEYFLSSGDKVRFFFEEGALNGAGDLRVAKQNSINKIGHALHDLDPVFEKFSHDARLDRAARRIGFTDPKVIQSMYIFKQPGIGGEVSCHQDATFLYTEPISVTGFWVALEDATIENGCLWALPGAHCSGLRSRFRRNGEAGLVTEVLNEAPFLEDHRIALEVPLGTLVILNGLLPHLSAANNSKKSRHAYALHVIDGSANYPPDNWLRRDPTIPLRGFL